MTLHLPAPAVLAAIAAAAAAAAASLCAYFEAGAGTAVFLACFALFAAAASLRTVRRERVVFGLLALLFSDMRVLGRSYDQLDSYGLIFKNAGAFCRAAVAFVSLFFAAFSFCLLLCRLLHAAAAGMPKEKEGPRAERRLFLFCALAVFAGSLPYLALYAPGLNIADTRDQILQFFGHPSYIGDGSLLTDHHPVLTTVIYGLFMRLGLALGSANAGQLLYSLFSLLAVALSTAYLLVTLWRCGLPARAARMLALFCALWPVTALYAFNMCKDVSAAPCVLLFSALMIRLWHTRGEALDHKPFVLALFFCALLLMMLRKSALYAMLFGALLLIPCLKGRRLRLALAMLGAAVCFLFYSRLLLPALHVAPGETREALSIPLQQAARALRDETDITPEERAALSRVMNTETAAEAYDPRLADPVKDATNPAPTRQDLSAFFGAWAGIGLRHPSCYVSAWLNMVYGYFYPSESNTIVCLTLNSPDKGDLTLTQDASLASCRLALHNIIYYRLRRIPALGCLFYADTVTWCFLFLLAVLALRGFFHAAPWGFFLGTLGICLLSPKSGEIRYLLPVLYALPGMLGAALLSLQKEGEP